MSQQEFSPIIQTLLASVKKHSSLEDAQQQSCDHQDGESSSSSLFLERRQLRTKILDTFKTWISSLSSSESENQKELVIVGQACLQIAQLRLTLVKNEKDFFTSQQNNNTKKVHEDQAVNNQDDADFLSNDATLNLVLDCADLFFDHPHHQNHQQNMVIFWQQLIIFFCTESGFPLEVSLRGFQLLVKYIINSNNNDKQNDENTNRNTMIMMNKCLLLSFSDDESKEEHQQKSSSCSGLMMSRLSSVLHEKFSPSQTRKFCVSSNFHQILQKEGLIQTHYSTSQHKRERDALFIATIFTSISHLIQCCGPQYLEQEVATIMASYLVNNEDNSVDDILEREILKPFVLQSIAEMFLQRGGGGEKDEEESSLTSSSPWSLSSTTSNNIPKSICILSSAVLNFITYPENNQNNETVEQWVRTVSSMTSSSIGLFSLLEQEQEETKENEASCTREDSSNNNIKSEFQQKLASITAQMLKSSSSSGSTAVKLIGLNSIQCAAVPLASSNLKNKMMMMLSNSHGTTDSPLPLLKKIVQESSSLLKKYLPIDTNDNDNFFATTLLPLGTKNATLFSSASNSNQEDSIGDAFWTMIEQLVDAPPFVELVRLVQNNSSPSSSEQQPVSQDDDNESKNQESSSSNNQIVEFAKFFVEVFVEPVLSPLMPSLVSLMSTTSQKELGRNLYQRRRVLANSLMRIEQLISVTTSILENKKKGLICGCSKIMWNKLKNSILVAGGDV